MPAIGGRIVFGRGDARVQPDVAPQVEAVRDVVEVAHEFSAWPA
jgi:hypothetical protein